MRLNPFEIRRQAEEIKRLRGRAKDSALFALFQATLVECANPDCPDPKTLAREALRAGGVSVEVGEL